MSATLDYRTDERHSRHELARRVTKVGKHLRRARSYSMLATEPPVVSAIDNLILAVEELERAVFSSV